MARSAQPHPRLITTITDRGGRTTRSGRPDSFTLTAVRDSHQAPSAAKVVAAMLAALLGWHFAATFLWNAPRNPVTDSVGPQVSSYMEPFFWQNWSLFAPNPINAENELLIRAEVPNPETGDYETTEWVSATALEWTVVDSNPFPSRASRLSANIYQRLSSAWNDLGLSQRDVLARDFFGMDDDWTDLEDALAADPGADAASETDIVAMVRADLVATSYASQVASAMWGENVTSVQFRIRRTPVPRWDDRFEEFDPGSSSVREFGWRPVIVQDGQDADDFAEFFVEVNG